MKRKMIIIGAVLAAAVIVSALIHTKENKLFPIDAEGVLQITFEICPHSDGNYTLTDDGRIAEIIHCINNLGLEDPDQDENTAFDETTYKMRCWHQDGTSDLFYIIRDDAVVAQNRNGRLIYSADCTELLFLLEAAYWEKHNGIINN